MSMDRFVVRESSPLTLDEVTRALETLRPVPGLSFAPLPGEGQWIVSIDGVELVNITFAPPEETQELGTIVLFNSHRTSYFWNVALSNKLARALGATIFDEGEFEDPPSSEEIDRHLAGLLREFREPQ